MSAVLLRYLRGFARAADAVVSAVGNGSAWIVLVVIAALFGQWPLREIVGAGHIIANDFGQLAHASVFMLGVVYALRWDGHVRVDVFYQRMSVRARTIVDLVGTSFVVVPWTTLIVWSSWATVARSVVGFEKFPETWSPGYWVFKVLLIIFGVLLLLQASGHIARDIATLFDPAGADTSEPAPGADALTDA